MIQIRRKGIKRSTEAPFLFCETAGQHLELSPFAYRASHSKHSHKTFEWETSAFPPPRLTRTPGLGGLSSASLETTNGTVKCSFKKLFEFSVEDNYFFPANREGNFFFCEERQREGGCGRAPAVLTPQTPEGLPIKTGSGFGVPYFANQPNQPN